MVECQKCHTLNPNDKDANYCKKCGEKLPEKKQSISRGLGGGDPPPNTYPGRPPVPDSLKGLRRR